MRDVALSTLSPPALPRDLVSRPALRAALDTGAARRLTLLSAPPGFGKSLLLADWVKRCGDVPAAWVSVEEEHDDPRLMWQAVLAALRGCPAVPASSRLRRLVVSRTTVERDFIDDVLRGLAALPRPLRLILDDVHHLSSGQVVDHLRMLVRDHGARVQLVLAGRLDPPLPLARLRLDDELCELRADRLRFSVGESAALVERSGLGLRLAPRQIELLHERTGGWVAGLRLAARSMRDHPDPDTFLAAFSGDERAVADYLVGEVLAGIPEDQREVLRRTSVADPVPAALAVELCDREDAADVLDAVGRDVGLVTCAGPERADYRVQTLLRSYLVADLQRQDGDQVAALHRRAARWWDRRGRPAAALRHAGRTGDSALVTDLLRRRAAELVASGEHRVLQGALETMGDEPGVGAWQSALAAQLHLEQGDRAAVAADVRRARRDGADAAGSDLGVLLTATERLAGLDLTPPPAEPPPDDPALAALARAGHGVAAVATGSATDGMAELHAALDGAHRFGLPLLETQVLCVLGMAAWAAGELPEAASLAAAATAAVHDGGWEGTGWAACARAVTAGTALERARPQDGLDAAEAGLRAAPADLDPVIRFALRVARGGALFDTGETAEGLLELQQARADVGVAPIPPVLAAVAALLEHRGALRLGYSRAAAAAASWLAGRTAVPHEPRLMRAWTEAAAGAHRAAGVTVRPLLAASEPPAWPGTAVEAWLVASRSALEDGDRPAARQALRTALDRARRIDAIRPFTWAPPAVRALVVDELVGGDERSRFAARVLAASARRRPGSGARAGGPVLTARERDVLARLPSLANLDEIAVDLSVSINTVKSHVRSIYDKLGAGTRRAAVLAAHEAGLLT